MCLLAHPRALAELAEIDPDVPSGEGDRFGGYGVMGLPFASGHLLALRRFPASSLGYGYSSVWHRDPAGRWTFWSDIPPEASCARYFGTSIDRVAVAPIRISWPDTHRLHVVVGDGAIDWSVDLKATAATLLLNAVAASFPEDLWRRTTSLGAVSRIAGLLLGAGRVTLTGRAPNGQRFTATPAQTWLVAHSHAMVDGVALGAPAPLARQVFLGEFAIPQRGTFMIGQACFESFDPARHSGEIARPAGWEKGKVRSEE
ncbi:MAG: hypothetical protein ABI742_07455 [Gemmatimonadota bacterium]